MSGRSKNRPGKDSVWLTNAWQGRISWRDCPLRVSYDNHQAGRPMLLPRSLTVAILGLIAVLVSAQTQAAPAPSRINREQAAESIVPQDTPPAACHVTLPSDSTFVLPSSLPVGYGIMHGSQFYFGSEKLWTILPSSGVWGGTWRGPSREPFDSAYSTKIAWYRSAPGFSWRDTFTLTGKRLDGPAPRFTEIEPVWDSVGIIGGISLPVLGCWEITGHYKNEELSFTIWVTLSPEQNAIAAEPSEATSEVPPTPQATPHRIHLDAKTQSKELYYKVAPDLPAGTEEANISRTVVLQAVINTDGRPVELRYLSGPPLLAQAAIDAVEWWRYGVALVDGERVEVDTTIEVVFPPAHD